MNNSNYEIFIPENQTEDIDQDREYCIVKSKINNATFKIGFHEYDKIYSIPGLYEYLFYNRLKCVSPQKICSLLMKAAGSEFPNASDLCVLDLGAGNGIVGEQLNKIGINSIYGIDIIKEAKEATERDHPDIYQKYYIADLARLSDSLRKELKKTGFNLMTTVGSLGFGDIPVNVFREGFNILSTSAIVAFNIREIFLSEKDLTGISALIKKMIDQGILEVKLKEKYRHRFSITGIPLYYMAIIGSKQADIPDTWVQNC